jgi:hypothetical protein
MDSHRKIFLEIEFTLHGSSLLKIQEIISFQILQLIKMMISIANGTLRILLMCLVARSGLSHVGTNTPIVFQQFLAKAHL